ncbi:MAG TPA: alpha-amylase family glycosyl hydrolase [Vicinamibacterales bacterium]
MAIDLLNRRSSRFVLWAPGQQNPQLIVGTFQPGAPPTLQGRQRFTLTPAAGVSGLFEISPASCNLQNGVVYHYWFEVDDTNAGHQAGARIAVCDPLATTTDWRLTEGDQPAAVTKADDQGLTPCDPDGTPVAAAAVPDVRRLPTNNRMVIYELPTAWTRRPRGGGIERGVGTFRDIVAMVDAQAEGANFDELAANGRGRAHIAELGVNAIELLPPADSLFDREWGYGTSHLNAPDYELGYPDGNSWPTSNADLRRLVEVCHSKGIRIIVDIVMGFARNGPYQHIDFDDFHIAFDRDHPPADPDAFTSRAGEARQDFGSRLYRYVKPLTTYDPIAGQNATFNPARHLQLASVARWMEDFKVDGYRIDSVETVGNWDFIQAFMEQGRDAFRAIGTAQGLTHDEADARYLVVGEELQEPLDIIRQGRLNALWHEKFREYIRAALLGQNADNESFESTVRKAIDCRAFDYRDMAQAVIYLGTHDVEGFHKERLATMFRYQFPIDDSMNDAQRHRQNKEIGRRVKLGFACLLTAVGVPMILAGDEFADEHDLFNIRGTVSNASGKQVDPVNFSRLEGDDNAWRRDVLTYVKRLNTLRTTHPALAVNEVTFLHVDLTPSRRILVWQRGDANDPVIVVANFSDFETANPFDPSSEYVVPNWPHRDDFLWREVSQQRDVPAPFVGREPLFPWEAKVYARR